MSSVEVPSIERIVAIETLVTQLQEQIENLSSGVELTTEEKGAIQVIINLINKLIGSE